MREMTQAVEVMELQPAVKQVKATSAAVIEARRRRPVYQLSAAAAAAAVNSCASKLYQSSTCCCQYTIRDTETGLSLHGYINCTDD